MSHPATRTETDDRWGGPMPGRHAFDEDAALTPIFHALNHRPGPGAPEPSNGRRGVDPVNAFRQDPLTVPIPVQTARPGRHHRRGGSSDAPVYL